MKKNAGGYFDEDGEFVPAMGRAERKAHAEDCGLFVEYMKSKKGDPPPAPDPHAEHGRGDPEHGPDDPDCGCRGTALEHECACSGCGFCTAGKK